MILAESRQRILACACAACFFAVLSGSAGLSQAQQPPAGSIVSWGGDTTWWGPESGSGYVTGIPQGEDFIAVSSGYWYAVALRSDGTLAIWGLNHVGSNYDLLPVGNDFVAIAASQYEVLALRSDGTLAGGGVLSPPPGTFKAVAAAARQIAAIRSDGSIARWGSSENGADVSEVPAGNDFVAISGSWEHFVALREDGSVVSFGLMLDDSQQYQPAMSPEASDFVAVSAGRGYGVGVRSDGSLYGWGFTGHYNALDLPEGNDFVAVSAIGEGGVALRSDGSLAGFGRYQANVPAGNDFCALGTGVGHADLLTAIRRAPPPPVAIAGQDQALHCDSPHGATVTLDGSASFDPQGDNLEFEWAVAEGSGVVLSQPDQAVTTGTFPLGVHEATLTVYDVQDGVRKGGVGVDSVTITVFDDSPPIVMVTTDRTSLVPANNGFVPVAIRVVASDYCTAPDDLVVECSILSSQPDDTMDNGRLVGDVNGSDGFSAPVEVALESVGDGEYQALVYLRAERYAPDPYGRVYSVNVMVMDASLNVGQASTTVNVPHDRRPR